MPLSDLQEYFKFCLNGSSSLPKTSKVAEIVRALQKSPIGSPMLRGRSPSPGKGGFSPPPLNLDGDDLQDAVEEQRTYVLRKIITGFKFVAAAGSPVCPDSPSRSVYIHIYGSTVCDARAIKNTKRQKAKQTRRLTARDVSLHEQLQRRGISPDSSTGVFCCLTSGRHRPSLMKRLPSQTHWFPACR